MLPVLQMIHWFPLVNHFQLLLLSGQRRVPKTHDSYKILTMKTPNLVLYPETENHQFIKSLTQESTEAGCKYLADLWQCGQLVIACHGNPENKPLCNKINIKDYVIPGVFPFDHLHDLKNIPYTMTSNATTTAETCYKQHEFMYNVETYYFMFGIWCFTVDLCCIIIETAS